MAMTDHFTTIQDINDQASFICPGNEFIEKKELTIEMLKSLVAYFYKVTFPVKSSLINLKEIWIYNESHLDRFLVLSKEAILINHLNNIRDNNGID